MKFLVTVSIFFLVPFVLFAFLVMAALPLFIQHFFHRSSSNDALVYPYLTSWEEAA